MIHPIKSIQARMQTWTIKHFDRTGYGRYLKMIRNSHEGESCFIIGNGPSLKTEDLDVIHNSNIDSFAVNRIFKLFNDTQWRPTYYVNTDDMLLKDCLDSVNSMDNSIIRLLVLQNRYYHGIDARNAHYFKALYGDNPFYIDCTEGVRDLGTVTIACMQLAAHMGYKTVYLIGIDHNFDKIITDEGEITIDPSVQNHFCDDYSDKDTDGLPTNIGQMTKGYLLVKPFLEKNGIKVYNASRSTKLTVFERVDFEEAIKRCKKEGK